MSWHVVDGVPLPDPVGGHVALDFCNTRAGWRQLRPKEYLTSPRALTLWAVDAGLLPHASGHDDTADVGDEPVGGDASRDALRRALALREALYRCVLGGGGPAEGAVVAREIVAARAASTLVPTPDGGARWHLELGDLTPATAALHAVAVVAEELLVSPLAGCVAACPGEGCGWLFADRRRRRRWCSMAVCGNRAKARRYAARRSA
jgi:predicted RNA-binding Zn ribbon-like protein